jgi:hypothetical protein
MHRQIDKGLRSITVSILGSALINVILFETVVSACLFTPKAQAYLYIAGYMPRLSKPANQVFIMVYRNDILWKGL